jgi:hypothetical protein
MGEFTLECRKLTEGADNEIAVTVVEKPEEDLLYKFIIGFNGTWNTIKDFSNDSEAVWSAGDNGKYVLMVQAKKEESSKSFDYVTRMDYITGNIPEKLIDKIVLNNVTCKMGDRVVIKVHTSEPGLLYRYLKKDGNEWKLIKDYSVHNMVAWSTRSPGIKKIIVECKKLDSTNEFDDFLETQFEVMPVEKSRIMKFNCLTAESDILIDNPILFEAQASAEEGRSTFYKFIKMDTEGNVSIIQEYSSNTLACCTETRPGSYKLMCMVKDMYSKEAFDDKKVISYEVKPYKDIVILSFTSSVNSPQAMGTPIILNADAAGGNELVYKFVIEGEESQDSGYSRNNTFTWVSSKPGQYKLNLFVKDVSSSSEYEASSSIDYIIDDKSEEPVTITQVIVDKSRKVLVGDKVNVKAVVEGGLELKYSFIVSKDNKILDKIDYGMCSWVNYIPQEEGLYEVEVRVKDKFSQREFDSHSIITIEALRYIPAKIEYVLIPSNEYFVAENEIPVNVIVENSSNQLIKYVLKINGYKVEESNFQKSTEYTFTPKCSGLYTIEVLARNADSDKTYDSMKDVNLIINEALPITNTKILSDRKEIRSFEAVTFSIYSEGGSEIMYEFHLMAINEWNVVQKYSRKSFYTFMPYTKGKYRILAICKSSFRKCEYEDYDIMEFEVK